MNRHLKKTQERALLRLIQGTVGAVTERWATAIFTRLSETERSRDAGAGLVSGNSEVTVERSGESDAGVSPSLPDMQKLLALYKNKAMQNNKLPEFALQLMALAYQDQDPNTAKTVAREMLLEMVRAIDDGEIGEGTANILVAVPGFGNR
jgi:hypothetical protein